MRELLGALLSERGPGRTRGSDSKARSSVQWWELSGAEWRRGAVALILGGALGEEESWGPRFPTGAPQASPGRGRSPSRGALWPRHPCHLRFSCPLGRGRGGGGSRPGKPEPRPLAPPSAPPPAPHRRSCLRRERPRRRESAPWSRSETRAPRATAPETRAALRGRPRRPLPSAPSESPAVQGSPSPRPRPTGMATARR